MVNRYTKKCSVTLIIMEIQIKTTMAYYLTFVRMVVIKKTSVARNMEKRESLYTISGNVNWHSPYATWYGDSSKNKEYNYHLTQLFPFWVFIQRT